MQKQTDTTHFQIESIGQEANGCDSNSRQIARNRQTQDHSAQKGTTISLQLQSEAHDYKQGKRSG